MQLLLTKDAWENFGKLGKLGCMGSVKMQGKLILGVYNLLIKVLEKLWLLATNHALLKI